MRFKARFTKDASLQPLTGLQRKHLFELSDAARRLDERHAIPATSGNFSLRVSKDECFISRSGLHKRFLTPSEFLRVSLNGDSQLPPGKKPSDEFEVHKMLYRLNPEANCILHCHALEIEKVRSPGLRLPGHELLKALGFSDHKTELYLNTFENTQDMTHLALQVERLSQASPAQSSLRYGIFVLEQHGIYCSGKSVGNAEARLEALLHLLNRIR